MTQKKWKMQSIIDWDQEGKPPSAFQIALKFEEINLHNLILNKIKHSSLEIPAAVSANCIQVVMQLATKGL